MRLIVVRHGATLHNAEARFTGQTDAPLSDYGLTQARAVAKRLRTINLATVVSSDLLRATQTAEEIIAARPSASLSLDPDLREIALGVWEGLTYAEVRDQQPEALALWQRDPIHGAPPGGETALALQKRVIRAFERWRRPEQDATMIWVTHGGVISALLCYALDLDLSKRWQFRRDNAAITELDVGADYIIVMRVNDTAHLEGLPDSGLIEDRQAL
ncbi:MAG TPA: histidine phosphatase family protein [Ktedonobacterales bacterium]|jgi:broad specificity phosphatase PhoE